MINAMDEQLRPIRPSPRHPLVLLAGETVLRADPVHVSPAEARTYSHIFGQLAVMTITNRRVVFLPPDLGWAFTLKANASEILYDLVGNREQVASALGKVRSCDLSAIIRFWKWQPEFSAPPAMQISATELITFDLQLDQYPWGQRAPIDAVREHFSATTAAWEVARSEPLRRMSSDSVDLADA